MPTSVPKFSSVNEAVIFAHSIKWNEPLFNMAYNLQTNYMITAAQNIKDSSPAANKRFKDAMDQVYDLKMLMKVMKDYKDNAMNGAVVYAGSVPL